MAKKLLLVFSAFLFASVVNAQSDAAVMLTLDAEGVIHSSSTSGSDHSYISTLPGGENILADMVYLENGDRVINIKKIGVTGTVSTLQNLLLPSAASIYGGVKGLSTSIDGSFTCLFGDLSDLYLVKFNNSGSVAWQKKFYIPDATSTYYNHSLAETSTGQFYITVSCFEFVGIIKVDSFGNMEWAKRLAGPRDDGKCPGFCTEATDGGGCITTLKDSNYETLIQLGADGSLIWSRSYGDMLYRWTKSIKADNLGNFYVMGTFGSAGATFIQKIDANGNFIYAKTLSSTTTYQDAYVTNSNNLIILSIHPSLTLTRVGENGNIIQSRGIGGLTPGDLYSTTTMFSKSPSTSVNFLAWLNDSTSVLFKTPEDLSGICNSYNNVTDNTIDDNEMLNAEVDSTCNISPLNVIESITSLTTVSANYFTSGSFCSFISASVNELNLTNLNIYPNPATDHFNIDMSNTDVKNAILVIYDMTGRKVFEKQLNATSMETISTTDYAAGLYTIVISNAKEVLAKKRVVVQK